MRVVKTVRIKPVNRSTQLFNGTNLGGRKKKLGSRESGNDSFQDGDCCGGGLGYIDRCKVDSFLNRERIEPRPSARRRKR